MTARAAPNAAFISARDVVQLDDTGKLAKLADKAALIVELTTDRDGALWTASIGGKITGYLPKRRTVVQLPIRDHTGRYPVAMTAASTGGIWALGRERLFRISPSGKLEQWPTPVKRILGPASMLEIGGAVWIASDYGVHQLANGKWQTMRTDRHELLARDTHGALWTTLHRKDKPDVLVGFDGATWTEVPIEGEGVAALAPGKDGTLYVVVWGKGWKDGRIDVLSTANAAANGTAKATPKLTPTWTTRRLGGVDGLREPVILDGRDRLWASHDHGLLVLDAASGKRVADLAPGSVAGLDGSVFKLAVTGAGPSTLPTTRTVPTGTLVGRLRGTNKSPLANLKLELCVGNCFDGAPHVELSTDASGAFRIDHVPALEFTSFRVAGTNTIRSLSGIFTTGRDPRAKPVQLDCCLNISPDRPLDLGTLDVLLH
ncbi:MAG TPA: hypothetical protein VFQ53_28380 [Kofleriaceae bacterium]|nr:hypothetical protein [Kofleriaceae bacterium]